MTSERNNLRASLTVMDACLQVHKNAKDADDRDILQARLAQESVDPKPLSYAVTSREDAT